ncbi:MAG: hypothetical protein DRP70_09815 [Spirochaetes bacterium]|nr:MAG: hypothetical protein DRP70_09815 [Spirochaetota bacterium]
MGKNYMIKDSVQNTAVYNGIHPGVDKVLETIASGKYLKWDSGRHDIQGNESIAYAERSVLTAEGDFNEDSDIGFFGGSGDPIYLREGDSAVFFPEDGHAPGLTAKGEPSRVRKAVFKIRDR